MTDIAFEQKHPRQDGGKFAAKEGTESAVELEDISPSQRRVNALAEAKMLTPIAMGRLFNQDSKPSFAEIDFQDEVMLYHSGDYPDGANSESTSDLDTIRYAAVVDAERGRVFGERYAAILRREPVTLTYQGTEYQATVKDTDGLYLELEGRRDAEGRYVDDTTIDYISLADPRLTAITQDNYDIGRNESKTHTLTRLGYGKRGQAEAYVAWHNQENAE